MSTAADFRERAEQCRRLASGLNDSEPAKEALLKLAIEFDNRRIALEAEADAPTIVDRGDDIDDLDPASK
jgi:hypothetical protein